MTVTALDIRDVRIAFEDVRYRTPIKFGGVVLDRATLLNVECDIEAPSGRRATGFGSMPLGNVWAFPSKTLPYDSTLGAMKRFADDVSALYRSCGEIVHPIDTTMALEGDVFAAAARIPLAEPMPRLAALVVASPFDAALHDAFGKLHGVNCYRTFGPDFMVHDLGRWLGREFDGLPLTQFVRTEPSPTMPVYHLVGALRSARRERCRAAGRRRPSRDARRVDSARRTHASQDQAQRRRPRLGCQSRARRRSYELLKPGLAAYSGTTRSISTNAVRMWSTCWTCFASLKNAGREHSIAFSTSNNRRLAI